MSFRTLGPLEVHLSRAFKTFCRPRHQTGIFSLTVRDGGLNEGPLQNPRYDIVVILMGFREALKCSPMMQRGTSPSDSCMLGRWRISSLGTSHNLITSLGNRPLGVAGERIWPPGVWLGGRYSAAILTRITNCICVDIWWFTKVAMTMHWVSLFSFFDKKSEMKPI